jgi:hypothetical protein
MFLLDFPQDVLLKIWEMTNCDTIKCSLVLICKEFREIGFKFGWIRSVKFSHGDNLIDFTKFYSRHCNFLERIRISGVIEPHISVLDSTLPWPKEIEFERCYMGCQNYINIPVSPTERLVIRDLYRRTTGGMAFHLNWESLPKLKVLDIYSPDIDFNGLDSCKNLEVVRIDLDRIRFLPSFFADFPNLRVIATTCLSNEPLHFLSKNLRVCMITKRFPFTSESLIVPSTHLGLDPPMNIQCLEI